jgi:hypothetical protein
MKRFGRILALALAFGAHVTACGSDARATDACKQIEKTRCARYEKCQVEGFSGTVESCQRFYDVQCGRGIPEAAKEPSRSELTECIRLINSDCAAVKNPQNFCPFLTANDNPVVTDSGSLIPDMGTAADAADEGG